MKNTLSDPEPLQSLNIESHLREERDIAFTGGFKQV